MNDHSQFQSPFSWRYGSPEMRSLWSEVERRRRMRKAWFALAEAQAEAGLVTASQLSALEQTMDAVDIQRAAEIEATTRHDVMAEVLSWAEQVPEAGGILHLGATSADITEAADAMAIKSGLGLLRTRLTRTVAALSDRVEEQATTVTMGWTHLQPAAPTTVGYRLAMHLTDLVSDLDLVDHVSRGLKAKGFKGATGTRAGYAAVLEGRGMSAADMEAQAMTRLGLSPAAVTSQVLSRKQDWLVLTTLSGICGSASTLAVNIRLLQSPPFGEWSEPFLAGQIGSSAMPWKRNPISAENLTSLARYVAALPRVAWDNAAASWLERTLDDSANRRIVLPEAFLATDEVLSRLEHLVSGLVIDAGAVAANLDRYGPFVAAERVLLAAAAAGGDRQALHARIRDHSMAAWQAVRSGRPNPLAELLAGDHAVTAHVTPERVRTLMTGAAAHVGDAPARAQAAAAAARGRLAAPAPDSAG